MKFTPIDDCNYKNDYERIFTDIANGHLSEIETYRALILDDLWFLVYFVMEVSVANHPFWVSCCAEVQSGKQTNTLDLWAREHGKSTIITIAETIQRILKNQEERVAIFSHTRPAAKSFLRSIKHILQGSAMLKECFPKILYQNPERSALKWSEDDGLIVKRRGNYKEATLEAWGLLEGMPTGKHFTHRVYDDIVTADHVNNPDTMQRLKVNFDLSQNLGVLAGGTHRVIGTFYHHEDPLVYIQRKKNVHDENIYVTRIKPATHDGSPNGIPVLLPQDVLDNLRAGDEYTFNCQQLLNPTPTGARRLDSKMLREVAPNDIPKDIEYFMMVDPAGDDTKGKNADAWGMLVCGVSPKKDNLGASNVYIVDAFISPCGEAEAVEQMVRMYRRNGVVQKLGIEKAGLSSVQNHVAKALAEKGRRVSVDDGTLVTLRHANRKKTERIERALAWPLHNSKIHVSTDVAGVYRERLRMELDKYPHWHDDGIDALAYLYDMIQDHRFSNKEDDWYWLSKANEAWKPQNAMVGY